MPGPSNLPRSGRADRRRPFFSIKEGRRPWQIKLTDEAGAAIMPFLILDWVEWEGPIAEPGPTLAQRQYMPEHEGDPVALREVLARFAERAFRRPSRPPTIERFARLVEAELASGEKFAAAVKTGHARDPVLEGLSLPCRRLGRQHRRDQRLGAGVAAVVFPLEHDAGRRAVRRRAGRARCTSPKC